jgi:L-ascorbate metabolism protein UlaG (beta-lactamase superfamily)
MKITYLGHSTLLIEVDDVRLLTDPLLRPRVAHLKRTAPSVPTDELAATDLVLVSHAHHDHLDVPSLRRLPGKPQVLCPPAGAAPVARAGMEPKTMRPGDLVQTRGLRVEAVPADHDGRRWPISSDRDALGFVISGSTGSVYFAGDTGFFDAMAERRGVDVALLPVAGWGPKLGPGHLDPRAAARAAALIEPRIAIPIHWGGYRRMLMRSGGAADAPARRFAAFLAELAPQVVAEVLRPGESLVVAPRA